MRPGTVVARPKSIIYVLESYATWLFASLIILVSILLFYFGPQLAPTYKDAFVAVSTSLISSLVFAIIYSSVVERHHQRVVNAELSQSVKLAVDEMKQIQQEHMQKITDLTLAKIEEIERSYYHEISLHFRELIPADYFPPTNQPDKRFNQTVSAALAKSRHYFFKGVTGRHIPSRLTVTGRHNLACKVLLVDPGREDFLRLYVRDRFGTMLSNQEVARQVEKVKREIYMTIVDLFDQAHWMGIEIKMYQGPVFYRTEIFDEQVLISYFTAKTSTAYPTTYLYGKESFFYDAFLIDFNQTFDLASLSITFNSKSSEQDLLDFLTKIGCDVTKIAQLRQEAEAFRLAFIKDVLQ